jgi:hypothetical protein
VNAVQGLSLNVPVQDLTLNYYSSHFGQRNTPTMGANLRYPYRFTNHSRVDYIPGSEVQDLGINSEYTVNEDSYCQSTSRKLEAFYFIFIKIRLFGVEWTDRQDDKTNSLFSQLFQMLSRIQIFIEAGDE